MRILDFKVTQELDGKSVLCVLSHYKVSRRLITKLKRIENGITLNGVHTRTIDKVKSNDTVSIILSDEKRLEGSSHLNVPVAYEDEDVIVYNKPAFMPVHPSHKHQGDTLGNYFASQFTNLSFRPINRLDKDTSGLCVVAKNRYSAPIVQSTLKKTYYAIAEGKIIGTGTIEKPIARVDNSIIKRCINENGQKAVTHYEVLKSNEKYSYLKINLETGRTHQIRVHFSSEGHPLAGDDMYGGSLKFIKRQALHCKEVSFFSPVQSKIITVTSDLPDDMKSLIIY